MHSCPGKYDQFDSCRTVTHWFGEFIIYVSFGSFLFCSVILVAIILKWNFNDLMTKNHWKLLIITVASQISSLTSIIFSLDPIQFEHIFSHKPHLDTLCQAQAVSFQIVYLFQSIIPFVVLEMYKLGLSKMFNLCTKRKPLDPHHPANAVLSHSMHISRNSAGSLTDLVTQDTDFVDNEHNNKRERNKSICVGLLWVSICLITCFVAVFGYNFGFGFSGEYKGEYNNIGYYGCYCQSSFGCYFIWAAPNIILEIYFVVTALRAFSVTVHRALLRQAQVIGYVVVRSIIIAWTIPISLRDIYDQRSADEFAGYMSITMVFISFLSVGFMVLPTLWHISNNRKSSLYDYEINNILPSIWSPLSMTNQYSNTSMIDMTSPMSNHSGMNAEDQPMEEEEECVDYNTPFKKHTISSNILNVIEEDKKDSEYPEVLRPLSASIEMLSIHTIDTNRLSPNVSRSPNNSPRSHTMNRPMSATPGSRVPPKKFSDTFDSHTATATATNSSSKTNTVSTGSSTVQDSSSRISQRQFSHFSKSGGILGEEMEKEPEQKAEENDDAKSVDDDDDDEDDDDALNLL